MIQKIALDTTSLKEIIGLIHRNWDDVFVFYNDQSWSTLNRQLVFSLILYIRKYLPKLSYRFYNVPFCVFQRLWKNFIEEHCILNRLCNYYEWYTSRNICNQCTFWLFCNNFNSRINEDEFNGLEWFQEKGLIKREDLLEKIYNLYLFVIGLGYKESEISFYITQKFMVDFLEWKFLLSQEFLRYFTIYFLVGNAELTSRYFIDMTSFSLVFKDPTAEKNMIELVKKFWINVNFTFNGEKHTIRDIPYKGISMRLNYFYSVEKEFWKKVFFDFQEKDLIKKEGGVVFKWSVLNKRDLTVTTPIWIIKKAWDLYNTSSEIYLWRDIISWLNVNNYKWILLTSDNLGEQGRLKQSLNSIQIPVIYNITPNILEILENGDTVSIDFNSWIIRKCN